MSAINRFHINDMKIILTDETTRYQSGDYITGKVVLSVNGQVMVTVIKINLNCITEVKWIELPGLKSEGHNIHIKRKYLEYNYQLPEEFAEKYLNDGINEIPFMFRLPDSGIPSSFDSTYGTITYFIEAYVSDVTIDEEIKADQRITVESPFKDNLFLSVGASTEKELGILNLGSGNIKIHANIFKKGYQPGEAVEVMCHIHNNSTADVKPRATLYQTQIFMTGEKHKTIETTVTEASFGPTIENGVTANSLVNLKIPEDMPLSLKCPNITLKYFIHVTLDIPHSFDLHLNLPIIITNSFALNNI